MRLFGEHEFCGARERIERAFGECAKLKFSVTIGEVREHKKRQPIRRFFIERTEDARIVRIARIALQQRIGLFAAIATEMFVQQVHHRPQVTALFHIDLKQVSQVVHRRRGEPEMALLLNRRRLGVTLRDDDAAQVRAMLARHVLPRGLADVLAKMNLAGLISWVHKNAPSVVGHLDVIKLRPTRRINAHGRAQIHFVLHRALRAHIVPPVEVVWLPMLKRTLQRFVLRQIHVIGDSFAVINAGLHDSFPIKKQGSGSAISVATRSTENHVAQQQISFSYRRVGTPCPPIVAGLSRLVGRGCPP